MEDHPHKMISLDNYLQKSQIYIKYMCPTHGKEFVMCCKYCYNLMCQNCNIEGKCKGESNLGNRQRYSVQHSTVYSIFETNYKQQEAAALEVEKLHMVWH